MLEKEEANELIKRAQNGDDNAKTILIDENAPLIKSIIRRFKGRGVEYDDLYQLGCMGLLKAIRGFSFEYDVKFSTYAVPMITGEVKRFLRDDGFVKVSRSIKTDAVRVQKYIESYRQEHQTSPTVDCIAQEFGLEPHDVALILDSSLLPVSIYSEDEDNGQAVIDKIASDVSESDYIDNIVLRDVLTSLSDRDRKIILLRYFRGNTQCEVAKIMGVSQVQVSRLENKILTMMKEQFSCCE